MADMFNGLMVLPNLLGLLALSGLVARLLKDYDRSRKSTKGLSGIAARENDK